jgi:hypothetical protein
MYYNKAIIELSIYINPLKVPVIKEMNLKGRTVFFTNSKLDVGSGIIIFDGGLECNNEPYNYSQDYIEMRQATGSGILKFEGNYYRYAFIPK